MAIVVDCTSRHLVMMCSKSKLPHSTATVAPLDYYGGPLWQDLRKWVGYNPERFDIMKLWLVSAEYGLIEANQLIAPYDRKLTDERIDELLTGPDFKTRRDYWRAQTDDAEPDVFFCGSDPYWKLFSPHLDLAQLIECSGDNWGDKHGGIGMHRASLAYWLNCKTTLDGDTDNVNLNVEYTNVEYTIAPQIQTSKAAQGDLFDV